MASRRIGIPSCGGPKRNSLRRVALRATWVMHQAFHCRRRTCTQRGRFAWDGVPQMTIALRRSHSGRAITPQRRDLLVDLFPRDGRVFTSRAATPPAPPAPRAAPAASPAAIPVTHQHQRHREGSLRFEHRRRHEARVRADRPSERLHRSRAEAETDARRRADTPRRTRRGTARRHRAVSRRAPCAGRSRGAARRRRRA